MSCHSGGGVCLEIEYWLNGSNQGSNWTGVDYHPYSGTPVKEDLPNGIAVCGGTLYVETFANPQPIPLKEQVGNQNC
jgi:hypothetical protein